MRPNNHLSFKYALPLLLLFAVSIGACRSGKDATSSHTSSSSTKSKKITEKYATLLNVSEGKIENIKLYSFIDEWYGVPYKYGGKNKNGIDCSNFTATLYSTIYGKSISGSSASIFDQCKVISKSNLEEGDLVFFKIDGNKISHIGVYLQNNKFVHATTKKGVMIDDLDEDYYKKYYYKAGRLK
ncbi:MAG: C40 family peptidase [Bacteroidetes bacterium]|nr:C40 family peptidase [Bacteroidota bacterium]